MTLLVSLFLSQAFAHEPVTYFHGRDPYRDFTAFFGLAEGEAKEYRGRTAQGETCGLRVERNESEVIVSPVGVGHEAYRVAPGSDVNGGFTTSKLWSSYFIDVPGSRIPGQFGTSYAIEVDKDAQGRITRFERRRIKMMDLGFKPLYMLECSNLE